MGGVMLDAGPLLDLVEGRGGVTAVLHSVGVGGESAEGQRWRDALRRVRRQGVVSVWLADRVCVGLLGTLPELVWGDAFFEGCDGEVAA